MVFSFILAAQMSLVSALDNPQKNFSQLQGATGIHRSISAIPNEPTSFGAGIISHFFSKEPFLDGNKSTRAQFHLNGNYTLGWKIPLEVFGGFTVTFNDNSTATSSRTMTAFENLDLGFRFGHRVFSESFFLGTYAHLRALSGTRSFRATSGGNSDSSGPFVSGAVGFLETFDKSKIWQIPLRQHFNISYRLPNGDLIAASNDFNRFALDSFYFPAIVPVVSVELVYPLFTPFVEYSTEFPIMTKAPKPGGADYRQKISFGSRITPHPSFSILLAGDVGIGGPLSGQASGIPRNPPYDIFVGIAFQSVGSKLKSEIGTARGMVTDEATGAPVSGVKASVIGGSGSAAYTGGSGIYEISSLRNGAYQIRFEKTGYENVVKSFFIRDGRDTTLDIAMTSNQIKMGGLEVSVIDFGTKEPVKRAFVSVSGIKSVHGADDNGKVKLMDVVTGEHSVMAGAPNYLPGGISIQISENKNSQEIISLRRLPPETGNCTGVVKNSEGTPLTAIFTSLDGKVSPFATDPASGIFGQSMSQGSYKLKVQAEHYLPQDIICNVIVGDEIKLEIVMEKPKEAVILDNKIVLPDAIFFESGSTNIRQESTRAIELVVDILLKNPSYKTLRVEGHTDNKENESLGEKRAQTLKNYLITRGVESSKISIKGFGKTKPIATNLVSEGRAENRRVEFNLVRD